MKLRRKCFSPTWRMKNSHVGIGKFLRGYWFWRRISLRAVRMLSAGGCLLYTSLANKSYDAGIDIFALLLDAVEQVGAVEARLKDPALEDA